MNTLRLAAIALAALTAACAPKVGSKAWCEKMDKQAVGDWSVNDAADYAKHCVLRPEDD